MKRLILLLIAGFIFLGCTTTEVDNNANVSEMPDPNERTFLYDSGRDASWPVNKKLAVGPDEAINVYGRDNISINECLDLSDSGIGTPFLKWETLRFSANHTCCPITVVLYTFLSISTTSSLKVSEQMIEGINTTIRIVIFFFISFYFN